MNWANFPWKVFFNYIRVRILMAVVLILGIAYLRLDTLQDNISLFLFILVYSVLELILFLRPLERAKNYINSIEASLPTKYKPINVINEDEWQKVQRVLTNTDTFVARMDKLIYEQNITSENLLESIFDAIVIVDPFLTCLTFNKTFKDFFLPHNNNIQERHKLWKIIHDETILTHFRNAFDSKQPLRLHQIKIPETSRIFDIVISPLIDADKNVIGTLGIFHDITKNIQIDKMRVDFVANVSHEIRTPLTSLKGYAQLLEENEQELPETYRPFVKKILNNTEKMISLFTDLLDLSVIESKDSITKEKIDLEEMFFAIKEKMRGKYLDRNFKVNLSIIERNVTANPRLIEQAFTNLIDNAIKYGIEDCQITVKSFLQNNMIHLEVSDNGYGIDEEHLARIFERFYRIPNETQNKVEGKGLGLSIVKHIILKHNGEISARSQKDQGTTIIIQMPLV